MDHASNPPNSESRSRPRVATSRSLFGREIDPTVFWALLFLMMTLVPSVLSHLPLLLGYSVLTGVLGGAVGILISVIVPFMVAQRVRFDETR